MDQITQFDHICSLDEIENITNDLKFAVILISSQIDCNGIILHSESTLMLINISLS